MAPIQLQSVCKYASACANLWLHMICLRGCPNKCVHDVWLNACFVSHQFWIWARCSKVSEWTCLWAVGLLCLGYVWLALHAARLCWLLHDTDYPSYANQALCQKPSCQCWRLQIVYIRHTHEQTCGGSSHRKLVFASICHNDLQSHVDVYDSIATYLSPSGLWWLFACAECAKVSFKLEYSWLHVS